MRYGDLVLLGTLGRQEANVVDEQAAGSCEQPSHPPPQDEGQVAEFLIARFGDLVRNVVHIGSGFWSCAYGFEHRGAAYVARFGRLVEDFEKDRIAAQYHSSALPIPRILEVGTAFDGFFAISERAYGDLLDELDLNSMRRLMPSLMGMLDAMRHVDLSATQGYGIWRGDGSDTHATWRSWLLAAREDHPRLPDWQMRLSGSPVGSRVFDAGYEQLTTLVRACPEERHLVHCDLLNRNVLVADNRIAAVIDWGSALYGDFLYDLAWLIYGAPSYPAWNGIDFREEARAYYATIDLRVPAFDERLWCYLLHISLGAQAWYAFTGEWDLLQASARRTGDILNLR